MAEIVEFPITTGRVDPDDVLEAPKGRLEDVIVVGWTKDGDFYLACSTGELRDLLFLSKLLDKELMEELDAN